MIAALAAQALAADFSSEPAPGGASVQASLGAARWVGVFGRHGEIGPVLEAVETTMHLTVRYVLP